MDEVLFPGTHDSIVSLPGDYNKREHVFRVQTRKGQFLIQVSQATLVLVLKHELLPLRLLLLLPVRPPNTTTITTAIFF